MLRSEDVEIPLQTFGSENSSSSSEGDTGESSKPNSPAKLFSLIEKGDITSLEDILKFEDLQQKHNGQPLLNWAISTNNQDLYDYLYRLAKEEYTDQLKATVDVEKRDPQGRTILYWAVMCNQLNEIAPLVSQGADVNAARDIGATPLCNAAQNWYVKVAELLLKNGADPNIGCTNGGFIPLYTASQEGHVEIVELLLERGANIDVVRTDYNATSLFIAAQQGHLEVVKVLLENGADFNIPTKSGTTPLSIAKIKGHTEIVKAITAEIGAKLFEKSIAIGTKLHKQSVFKKTGDAETELKKDGSIITVFPRPRRHPKQ